MGENSISQQLVRLCERPIDQSSRERAARHLLDWLGCVLAGAGSPVGREFARYHRDCGARGDCFVALAAPGSATAAAFVNGALGNVYELDDVHRTAVLHAGDVVVPAALALAQQRGSTAVELLDAIVCGYEIAIRLGLVAASGGYSAWYNSGTCGVFGAAMAAGKLLGLGAGQLADALGQAGMSASGLWQCRLEPTYSKQLACANAARDGVVAAQLAAGNFPGASRILEGELGFFATLYPGCEPTDALRDDATDWKLHEVSFKPWPACRHVHPALEAALSLRAQLQPQQVQSIQLHSYAAAIEFCDKPQPTTDHEARFSLQYCTALALLYGEPRIGDFDADRRADPTLAALAAKVQVAADEHLSERFPQRYGARVSVRLHDSRELGAAVDSALGDPENPLSPARLTGKFTQLAELAGIDGARAGELADCVLQLPRHSDLRELQRQLRDIEPG